MHLLKSTGSYSSGGRIFPHKIRSHGRYASVGVNRCISFVGADFSSKKMSLPALFGCFDRFPAAWGLVLYSGFVAKNGNHVAKNGIFSAAWRLVLYSGFVAKGGGYVARSGIFSAAPKFVLYSGFVAKNGIFSAAPRLVLYSGPVAKNGNHLAKNRIFAAS